MSSTGIDLRFAPSVAATSGILGGLLVVIARHGWQYVWPLIGLFGCIGEASLFAILRRDNPPAYLPAIIATSLAAVSVVAAVWGIATGVGW
jgi:hypothetical protein